MKAANLWAARFAGLAVAGGFLLTLGAGHAEAATRWVSKGPFGGLSWVVAVDPKTPTTLYEASPGGGIFKSTDGGTRWTAASNGLTDQTCLTLAIDPENPEILYTAGGNGIFESRNGAKTWTQISTMVNISIITIDPKTPTTLYAVPAPGQDPVFKSIDGGATWNSLFSASFETQSIYSFAIDPKTPTTLYAGGSQGLYKSLDGGTNWTLTTAGLGSVPILHTIAIDPANTKILYGVDDSLGLVKSSNGGASWALSTKGITTQSYDMAWTLAVDPKNPNIVYAASDDPGTVYISRNAGAKWVKTATNLGSKGNNSVVSLAIDPKAPATVYAGTSSGVFVSPNRGTSWSATSGGLANTAVTAIAVNPKAPNTIYAGTEYNGILKSVNGGTTWTKSNNGLSSPYSNSRGPAGLISAIAINPKQPNTLYAASEDGAGIFKTTNGGTKWTALGSTVLQFKLILSLAIDPKKPAILFAGTNGSVLMSSNSGTKWTDVGAGLAASGIQASTLLVSGNSVLAMGYSNLGYSAYIAPFTAGAKTLDWTPACMDNLQSFAESYFGVPLSQSQMQATLAAIGTPSYIVSAWLAVCPSKTSSTYKRVVDAIEALAATGPQIYAACSPNPGFAVDPTGTTTAFLGGACGVYETENIGSTKKPLTTTALTNGMPTNLMVNALGIVPSGKVLYAGTQGHGIYRAAVSP